MPRHDSTNPARWLEYAISDLALAKTPLKEGVMLETLCFQAQQAIEKSLKAVLIHMEIEYPKVHSIERLVTLLSDTLEVPDFILESAEMTKYATFIRYPGEYEEVTTEEYQKAIRLAESVLGWAIEISEST